MSNSGSFVGHSLVPKISNEDKKVKSSGFKKELEIWSSRSVLNNGRTFRLDSYKAEETICDSPDMMTRCFKTFARTLTIGGNSNIC